MSNEIEKEWRPWKSGFIPFTRTFEGALERGVFDVVAAAYAPYRAYEHVARLETPIVAPGVDGLPSEAEEQRLADVISRLYPALRRASGIPVADYCRAGKLHVWVYLRERDAEADALEALASAAGAKFSARVFHDPHWYEYARLLDAPAFVDGLEADRTILAEVATPNVLMEFHALFKRAAAAERAAVELAANDFVDACACGTTLEFGKRVAATIDEVAPAVFLAQRIVEQNGGSFEGWGTVVSPLADR